MVWWFILDPSVMLEGIASIKKWREEDVRLVISKYALRELDFSKKGMSLTAANARESIRFIDKNLGKGELLVLQNESETGPRWEKCGKWRVRNPTQPEVHIMAEKDRGKTQQKKKVSLPATATEDAALILREILSEDEEDDNNNNIIMADGSYKPKVPKRLKNMLRFCIYKALVQQSKKTPRSWYIVCDDPVSSAWYRCYGLKVISLIEAEDILRNGDLTTQKENVHSVIQHQTFKDVAYESRGGGQLWTP